LCQDYQIKKQSRVNSSYGAYTSKKVIDQKIICTWTEKDSKEFKQAQNTKNRPKLFLKSFKIGLNRNLKKAQKAYYIIRG
jgi:hypothetical protein